MRDLILLIMLGTATAVPRNIQRIVGGEPTTIKEYPYMANMQFILESIVYIQGCGGSLLNAFVVLSAAHCFFYSSTSQWAVRLGSSYAESGGQVHSVSKMIFHESFDYDTSVNDIALIQLASPADLNNGNIATARIPSSNFYLPDDADVTIIGWGDTEPSVDESLAILRHVHVKSINQKICAERYAYLKSLPETSSVKAITDDMLCAGLLDVGGKDACQGDSGGPLAHARDIVVGVTSWGHGCANETYPGVNARVSYFSKWILDNVQLIQ